MMKSATGFLLSLIWALGLGGVAPAAGQLEDQPGYFPIDDLGLLSSDAVSLEINLAGGLLDVVASAVAEDDPEFAELVRGLEGIAVRVADVVDVDVEAVRFAFERSSEWLRSNGWEVFLRLREDDEQISVYTRLEGGEMVGATVMVLDPASEVVVVNVIGRLDLALLAGLADSLDISQLDLARRGPDAEEGATPPEQPR